MNTYFLTGAILTVTILIRTEFNLIFFLIFKD